MSKLFISPSLLSADMARLAEAVEAVQGEADYIHCDVMDAHFVPNLTFGAPIVSDLKKLDLIPLDVHLMIESPGKWIDAYLDTGLENNDFLTFHFEAEPNPIEVIEKIRKANVSPGISIKPGTPFEEIQEYLELVDMLLIMTVEPGFGNQKFMSDMLPKISKARSLARSDQVIAVDGGINLKSVRSAVKAGSDFLVAGSAVYGQKNPIEAIQNIRELAGE